MHLTPTGQGGKHGLLTKSTGLTAYRSDNTGCTMKPAVQGVNLRPHRLHGAVMGASAMPGAGAGAGPKSESKGPAQRTTV